MDNKVNEPVESYGLNPSEDLISKARLMQSLEALPDKFSIDELMDRLLLVKKIEAGLSDVDKGRTYSTEEAREKLAKWLK